jgi:hypothetical protein
MFKDQDCHFIRDKDAKFLAQCEEKAYRRGVSQTFAMLCASVRGGRLVADVATLDILEAMSHSIRYDPKPYPSMLHQLIESAETVYASQKQTENKPLQTFQKRHIDDRRIRSYNGILTEHEYPSGTIRFDPPPFYSVLTFQNGGEMLAFDPDSWKHVAKAKPVKTGKVGRPRKLS